MNQGWFKHPRSILDNGILKDHACNAVHDWLRATATHQPMKRNCGGQVIPQDRGDVIVSERHLADELGISRAVARRCLKTLEDMDYIKKKAHYSSVGTTYSIIDYDCEKSRSYSDDGEPIIIERAPDGTDYPDTEDEEEQDTTQPKTPNKDADEVIDYLNSTTGSKFKHKEPIRRQIKARFREGYTKEECLMVVEHKSVVWRKTEFEKYLRPITLFSDDKFGGYLTDAKKWIKKGKLDPNKPGGGLLSRY